MCLREYAMSLEVKGFFASTWHIHARETGQIGLYYPETNSAYFTKNKTLAAKLIKLLKMRKVRG